MNKILVASFFAFCMLGALSACQHTDGRAYNPDVTGGGGSLLVPMIRWAF